MNPDKSRNNVQQIKRIMKAAASRGYDPRNSVDAYAQQWALAFRFRRVK